MKITVLGAGSAFNFAMGNVSYLVEETGSTTRSRTWPRRP
jgi:hypothetical protein